LGSVKYRLSSCRACLGASRAPSSFCTQGNDGCI
jgi:hypothetical protein